MTDRLGTPQDSREAHRGCGQRPLPREVARNARQGGASSTARRRPVLTPFGRPGHTAEWQVLAGSGMAGFRSTDGRADVGPVRRIVGYRPEPVPQAARRSYRNRTFISDQHLRLRENVGHPACNSRRFGSGRSGRRPDSRYELCREYAASPDRLKWPSVRSPEAKHLVERKHTPSNAEIFIDFPTTS